MAGLKAKEDRVMVDCRACRSVFACLAVAFLVAVPAMAARGPVADLSVGSASLDWTPRGNESMKLTVSGPEGLIIEQVFRAGQAPSLSIFDKAGQRLPDGQYHWELRSAASTVVKRQRVGGGEGGETTGGVQSGTFAIQSGSFVADEGQRETPARAVGNSRINAADQVIPDDLIVQGSECVGLDCVNNESFGFDTIRLKENNTRIKFDDTSTGTGFPANDWQLTANDSASGGSSKFSIEDITGSRVPFTITAGASTNSIFVDSTGRVGLRTSTPVLDLHINTSNTPAIRLEQNNSGGFTAQTWDVAGNEANFFVRDVTGGSRLPFRIRPGAPTSSVDISADGDVGIGTASPSFNLHVLSSTNATEAGKIMAQNSSGTTASRELLELRNNGNANMIFKDTSGSLRWLFGTNASTFIIDEQSHAGVEMTLSNTGNLTITGVYSPSDRNLKRNIVPTQNAEILARLAAMPVSTWSYKFDDYKHMGPMSQDFTAAFGLGIDDKTINPMDMAGVGLAAAKALQEELQAKDAEITNLKQRLEALEAAVATLKH